MFGATTIFYPNVLKELAEKHGTSLFLLPSSIHEFLILEDNGIYNPKELFFFNILVFTISRILRVREDKICTR